MGEQKNAIQNFYNPLLTEFRDVKRKANIDHSGCENPVILKLGNISRMSERI